MADLGLRCYIVPIPSLMINDDTMTSLLLLKINYQCVTVNFPLSIFLFDYSFRGNIVSIGLWYICISVYFLT